jgi:hypothetical protein
VKHGDLDSSLFDPTRAVDVHMASEGANLQCVDCHVTENYKMKGKVYSVSSMNRDRSTCESCHTETPHESNVINEHTVKVACQTCHIPVYVKVNPTKLSWDWSTAGKLKDGKPYTEHAEDGTETYMSIKGKRSINCLCGGIVNLPKFPPSGGIHESKDRLAEAYQGLASVRTQQGRVLPSKSGEQVLFLREITNSR